MKKIGIITLNDYINFGNRLQNYALVECINKLEGCTAHNIWIKSMTYKIKDTIKKFIPLKKYKRIAIFRKFNKKISTVNSDEDFDYYITGSDQVWNPQWAATDELLLKNKESSKKISYSASFGVNELMPEEQEKFKTALRDFKAISVRENSGKKIIENLKNEKNVEVLIDPTMLLTNEEWSKLASKPKNHNEKKYILNYFLGNLSETRKKAIEKIAKENNCEIINIMDKKDKYYVSGPSEFLWLEKNAFLVCTDSFHASVFAIIFDRPFVVFNRQEKENKNMGTRIDTLLSKFNISDRRYNNKEITKANLKHDYTEAYKILESERKKSETFLKKALDIK